jgi:hypothetical protein
MELRPLVGDAIPTARRPLFIVLPCTPQPPLVFVLVLLTLLFSLHKPLTVAVRCCWLFRSCATASAQVAPGWLWSPLVGQRLQRQLQRQLRRSLSLQWVLSA